MNAPVFYRVDRERVDATGQTYYVIRTAGGTRTVGSTRSYWSAVAYIRDVLHGELSSRLTNIGGTE